MEQPLGPTPSRPRVEHLGGGAGRVDRPRRLNADDAVRLVCESPITEAMLEALGGELFIVDRDLRLLAANGRFVERFGLEGASTALGLLPGEAMRCVNAFPDGCGRDERCSTCGARRVLADAILADRPAERDCQLTVEAGGPPRAYEFHIRACPVEISGVPVIVVSMRDITDTKRREALERVFLHDITNTVGGLVGWARLFPKLRGEQAENAAERIGVLSERVLEEIHYQRALVLAEAGELEPRREQTSSHRILAVVTQLFERYGATTEGRSVEVVPSDDLPLATDPRLAARVLVNMVKNALEATAQGGRVRISCRPGGEGGAAFSVWNAGTMPELVARSIFRRSFSTKSGTGRGIGTYSMNLLGEHYLGGRVSFTTSEEQGTTFTFEVP